MVRTAVQRRSEQVPARKAIFTPRIWPQLQPELADHIATFLPTNEVPATLRLINKAAASQFSSSHHKVIQLSRPVPHHAFSHRWDGPEAIRNLTLENRVKLLCLTAASGSITNLKLLFERPEFALFTTEVFAAAAEAGRLNVCRWLGHSVECPWSEDVAEAAARGGRLKVCKWLIEQGCPHRLRRLLSVAAGAGHQELCEWLLEAGAPLGGRGPRAAARGGHVGLMDRLLRPLSRERVGVGKLVAAVAEGCDLRTLQRVHGAYVDTSRGGGAIGDGFGRLDEPVASAVMAAAAGSATPDWQAKVEWLRSRGYPRTASACESAAETPGGASPSVRLAWLQQRGYPINAWVACAAARRGDTNALRQVFDTGVEVTEGRAAYLAAERGHLGVLQALHAQGDLISAEEAVQAAARGGHLAVVSWLVEARGAPLAARVFSGAAESGSMELLEWLRRHGCPWESSTFAWCAWVGCVEQLEWLAANGCPMGDDGEPYLWAGYNGDYVVLECLRKLGCPWSADGSTFTRAVCLATDEESSSSSDLGWCCDMDVLDWLVAEGCPVDWAAAERVARLRRQDEEHLLTWIQGQHQKHQKQQQQQEQPAAQ